MAGLIAVLPEDFTAMGALIRLFACVGFVWGIHLGQHQRQQAAAGLFCVCLYVWSVWLAPVSPNMDPAPHLPRLFDLMGGATAASMLFVPTTRGRIVALAMLAHLFAILQVDTLIQYLSHCVFLVFCCPSIVRATTADLTPRAVRALIASSMFIAVVIMGD